MASLNTKHHEIQRGRWGRGNLQELIYMRIIIRTMKLANTIINRSNKNRIFKCNLHNFFFRWVHATFDWTTPHESTGDEAEEILQLSGIFSVLYVLRTREGLLCAWDSSVTPWELCCVTTIHLRDSQRASVVPKDTRNILKFKGVEARKEWLFLILAVQAKWTT